MKTNQFQNSSIWLPYTQMLNHLPQLPVKTALGTEIFLSDGRILVDGIASWWSVAHGYQHPHLLAAMQKQLASLSHIMLAGFETEETYRLAARLCEFSGFDKVFFSDSGSTAIEVAMKIAWQFFINCRNPTKKKFVSFQNSYHGDTTGAMSLADLSDGMHQKFQGFLLENFCQKLPQNDEDLEKFEDFLRKNHQQIAAIFIEPMVQCAGGMKFSSAKILYAIFALAKNYKILTIADECAVGFYRTGKKFACDHATLKPDILVLGKALTGGMITLAATLVGDRIYEAFLGDSLDLALIHGPTFMGNPLACSAANASLDLFLSGAYEQKVLEIEREFISGLESVKSVAGVVEVRVLGAIAAIEMDEKLVGWPKIKELRKKIIESGVYLRPFGNCIYAMPPLNIKIQELKKVIEAMKIAAKWLQINS